MGLTKMCKREIKMSTLDYNTYSYFKKPASHGMPGRFALSFHRAGLPRLWIIPDPWAYMCFEILGFLPPTYRTIHVFV